MIYNKDHLNIIEINLIIRDNLIINIKEEIKIKEETKNNTKSLKICLTNVFLQKTHLQDMKIIKKKLFKKQMISQ